MEAVRRSEDGELCGHVEARGGRWAALTIFGAVLGEHGNEGDARRHVLDDGLACLADRWMLRSRESGEEQVVCIQEANPQSVTLALGYYALPGVPSLTITVDDLKSGAWELFR